MTVDVFNQQNEKIGSLDLRDEVSRTIDRQPRAPRRVPSLLVQEPCPLHRACHRMSDSVARKEPSRSGQPHGHVAPEGMPRCGEEPDIT